MNAPRRTLLHVVMTIAFLLGAAGSVWGGGPPETVVEPDPQAFSFRVINIPGIRSVTLESVANADGDVYSIHLDGSAVQGVPAGFYDDGLVYRNVYGNRTLNPTDMPSGSTPGEDAPSATAVTVSNPFTVSVGEYTPSAEERSHLQTSLASRRTVGTDLRPRIRISPRRASGDRHVVVGLFLDEALTRMIRIDIDIDLTLDNLEAELFALVERDEDDEDVELAKNRLDLLARILGESSGIESVEFPLQLFCSSSETYQPNAETFDAVPDVQFTTFEVNFRQWFADYFAQDLTSARLRSPYSGFIELPSIGLAGDSSGLLYGPDRDPYVTAYLWFLFHRDHPKPLLERVYYGNLRSANVPYDYRDYEMLDIEAGRTLARMALRYLTWCVEYPTSRTVPRQGSEEPYSLAADQNPVFHLAFPPNLVDATSNLLFSWITGRDDPASYPALAHYYFGPTPDGSDSGIDDVGAGLGGNPFFQHLAVDTTEADSPWAPVAQRISTPFWEMDAEGYPVGPALGNPLPYTEHGIDSPRTFNYKMYERTRIVARLFMADPGLMNAPFADLENGWLTSGWNLNDDWEAMLSAVDARDDVRMSQAAVSDVDMRPLSRYIARRLVYPAATVNLFIEEMRDSIARLLAQTADTGEPKPFEPGSEQIVDEISLHHAGVGNHELLVGALSMMTLPSDSDHFYTVEGAVLPQEHQRYSAMDPGGTAPDWLADDNGLPLYPESVDSTMIDEYLRQYALQRLDIERSTVIVPDISLIQPGDLLVRLPQQTATGTAPEPEIAIVVGLGWENADSPSPGADITEYWDEVYAVTATAVTRTVTLGTWGNTDGLLTSFTQHPGEYHIRRLLVADGTSSNLDAAANLDSWDLLDSRIESVAMSIDWTADPYIDAQNRRRASADGESAQLQNAESHWIPNARFEPVEGTVEYEFLEAEAIRIWGVNPAGAPISLSALGNSLAVTILPPTDPHAGAAHEDDVSNVYNNRGPGFEFGYLDGSRRFRVLAQFEYTDQLPAVHAPYTVATSFVPGTLCVQGGRLVFRSGDGDMDTFAVRVMGADSSIRPGDDLLLRFEIDLGNNEQAVAEAPSDDFVAVYDKKMLWRANLYIDEGDGFADWNNAHPWSSDYNDWNHPYTGWTDAGAPDILVTSEQLGHPADGPLSPGASVLSGRPDGNGGQVVRFPAWTPVRGTETVPVQDRVAYDYPYSYSATIVDPDSGVIANQSRYDRFLAMDSPFDFVNKLMVLRGQMRELAENYVALWEEEEQTQRSGDTYSIGGGTYAGLALADTTAPDGRWLNYPNRGIPGEPEQQTVQAGMQAYINAGITNLYVPQMGLFYYAQRIPLEPAYAISTDNPAISRAEDSKPAENGQGLQDVWGVAGVVYGNWNAARTAYQLDTGYQAGDETIVAYDRPENLWGAGTDCVGFAQQAASYSDAPYLWAGLSRADLEDTSVGDPRNRAYPLIFADANPIGRDAASDVIVDRTTFLNTPLDERPELLSRIRPGDIMYYYPGHIAVVQDVVRNEDGEVEDLDSIRLIESTFGYNGGSAFAQVVNHRTLDRVHNQDNDPEWRIVRLR